jgi:hypothetical protein
MRETESALTFPGGSTTGLTLSVMSEPGAGMLLASRSISGEASVGHGPVIRAATAQKVAAIFSWSCSLATLYSRTTRDADLVVAEHAA